MSRAFLEMRTDDDYVHFLVQSVPMYSPKRIVQIIKKHYGTRDIQTDAGSEKAIYGAGGSGRFRADGYFVSTVGLHASEEVIKQYVKNQGASNENIQLWLF